MSKDTLQLPKTAFSMKASLPTKEPEILKKWEKNEIFKKLRQNSKGREKFVLHDGPPYANGHIHMGTALNKILKDIITRFHQMNGKDSVYVPGWDCHGLPIEWKIEEQYKKKKKNKDEVPIKNFRQECREFAKSWIEVHIKEFKRLGVVGDFENYYSTMSYEAEAQIVRELGKFLLDGSLYQGFKPVLWSTVEKTALADAEVEYMDHTSNTIYVAFKVKETKKDFLKDSSVIIWTTTPWTIPANKALAFNSSIEYSVLEIDDLENFKDKKIIVAKNLIDTITKECEIKKFKELKSFKGSELKDTICSHPFVKMNFDYDVPMLDAQFVNLEQGTGIVHCAPSHGPDDYNLCLKNNIPSLYTVDNAGLYTKEIPYFTNTHIFKADPIVIEKLKEQKKLLKNDKLNHSYPHSWRSKAPLIYRATPQWFISMQKNDLRKKAIKAINDTNFFPNKGKERLLSMVEGRPDWCVSRQRVWGVPLPIFINKKTKEPLRDQKVIDRIANIYEKQGSDCWFTDDPKVFLGDEHNPDDYEKLKDIVEVWFDSGSTHSFVLEKRTDLKWPASMYLEGSDQQIQFNSVLTQMDTELTNLQSGKGTLGLLLKDEKTRENLRGTIDNLAQSMEALSEAKGLLGTVIHDPEFAQVWKDTSQRLEEATEQLGPEGTGLLSRLIHSKKLADDLAVAFAAISEISKDINEGPGTLYSLIKDPSLFNDARETLTLLRDSTEDLREQEPVTSFFSILFAPF